MLGLMFANLIPMAANVGLIAAVVLIWLARRWPEQRNEFRRAAAWIGLVSGVVTLGFALFSVLDPDLMGWDGPYLLLLTLTVTLPSLLIIGAIKLLRGRRARMLVVSSLVWIVIVAAGLVSTL
jgi:hypothetical protein